MYECPQCDDSFEKERFMHSHHTQVHGESLCQETHPCSLCGSDVTRVRSLFKDSVLCDDCDFGEWQSQHRTGSNAANWQGGKERKECDFCGEMISVYKYNLQAHDKHFCGQQCYSDWQSQNIRGEKHPAWNGGKCRYYGENWRSMRRACVRRDEERCVVCGISRTQHKLIYEEDLHVHHDRKILSFDEPEEANTMGNLLTVCQKCHNAVEA